MEDDGLLHLHGEGFHFMAVGTDTPKAGDNNLHLVPIPLEQVPSSYPG